MQGLGWGPSPRIPAFSLGTFPLLSITQQSKQGQGRWAYKIFLGNASLIAKWPRKPVFGRLDFYS